MGQNFKISEKKIGKNELEPATLFNYHDLAIVY